LQEIKVRQKKKKTKRTDLRDGEIDGHFFPERKKIDDLKNCWGSLDFLGFSNNAAARKMGLRMQNDKVEKGCRRRRYL